ncbi:alkene reductase [Myroides sp. LJL110]
MKLLNSYQLHELKLANRVVMAPMTRSRAVNKDQKANELIALYYAQRASGGLLISEGTPVSNQGIGYINIPGIYTKAQVDGWRLVTEKVHLNKGIIFAQLWHVGRISHPDLLDGQLPLAPSAINPKVKAYTKAGFVDTLTPVQMTKQDIQKTIQDFTNAAVNAIDGGFDGIEIHAANGYLFHQFFMKCSNNREDSYGGSIENRARFLFDVLDSIAQKIDIRKVGVRIAPDLDGTFGITKDDESDQLFEYITVKLNNYNLAYLHISGFTGNHPQPDCRILEVAKKYRSLYKGHFMINGGFTKQTAEQAIQEGIADLVSFGSAYISNPDLVERFKSDSTLNQVDRNTVYGTTEQGFTDYPTLCSQTLK